MPKDDTSPPIALRLPPELLKRADVLAKRMAKDPMYQLHRVSRSFVLRLAVAEGLEALSKRLDKLGG